MTRPWASSSMTADSMRLLSWKRQVNVSAWVNEAMRLKVEHDRGLADLAAVIADFEAEHGEITNEEIEKAARTARSRAVTIRGSHRRRQVDAMPRPLRDYDG